MALPSQQPHSIWLCPEPQLSDDLTRRIEHLSRISGTPAFAPHVTLLGDLCGAPPETLRACADIMAAVGPVHATVTGISRTDDFFMSLFLDLRLSPTMTDLRAALAQRLGKPTPPAFRPHLSLAYGWQSPAASVLADLRADYTDLSFELTVCAVFASAREVPVAAWHPLHRVDLTL